MDISRKTEIRTLLANLFARRFMMLRIFLVMAVITLVIVMTRPTEYTVTGQVIVLSAEIYQQERNVLGDGNGTRYLPVTLKDIETEATMLRSLTLLRRTVHKLYDEKKLAFDKPSIDVVFKDPPTFRLLALLCRTVYKLYDEKRLVFDKSLADVVFKVPLRARIIAPLKRLMGVEEDVGDTAEEAVGIIMGGLDIVPLPGSNIIAVNYKTENVEQGRLIVDKLMDEYLQMRTELLISNSENLFSEKKQVYKERLNDLAKQKNDLFSEYNSQNPQEELSLLLQNINAENNEYNNISDQLLKISKWQHYLEENIKLVASSEATEISVALGPDSSRTNGGEIGSYTEIMKQIEQIRTLQAQFDSASVAFARESLPVEQVLDKLKLAKQRLVALFKNRNLEQSQEILVLQAIAEQKEKRLAELRKRAASLLEMMARTTEIDAELSAINEAYTQYSKIYEEKHLENLFSQDKWRNVKIMEYAPQPFKPSSPSPRLVLLVGLVAAFITALSAGLLIDFIRDVFGGEFGSPEGKIAESEQTPGPLKMHFDLLSSRFKKWLMP